jgi:hypothetical protein
MENNTGDVRDSNDDGKKLFDYVIELNKVVRAFAKKETRHKLLKTGTK